MHIHISPSICRRTNVRIEQTFKALPLPPPLRQYFVFLIRVYFAGAFAAVECDILVN